MGQMCWRLGLCMGLSLLSTLSVAKCFAAPAKPVLKWCLDELPPRHSFVNGVPQGYVVDMMQQLADRAGFALSFSQPTPLSRCLADMKNGKTDLMAGLLTSAERTTFMKLWPVDEAKPATAFIRKNQPAFDNRQLFSGRKVVLAKTRAYPDAVLQQLTDATVIYAEDVDAALALLWYGDADIMLGPQYITSFAISKNKRYAETLTQSAVQPLAVEAVIGHIGLSRASRHYHLAPKIEQALQQILDAQKLQTPPVEPPDLTD